MRILWLLRASLLHGVDRHILEVAGLEHSSGRAQALGVASLLQEELHAAHGELQLGSSGVEEVAFLLTMIEPEASFL